MNEEAFSTQSLWPRRLLLLAAIAGAGLAQAAEPAATGSIRGALRPLPGNPRYFTDDGKRAVYLTGSHTWDNLQDMGESDPPPAFDFNAYLDFLASHGHNFIRLWRWELVSWDTTANHEKTPRRHAAAPHPWARTGPGLALDGKPRFDLEKFDEDYFRRLRQRVEAARGRGIYVSVMLFEGWALQHVTHSWMAHPFHPSNTVTHLSADANGDGQGLEIHTLEVPAVTRVQEAYVRKVVETVNGLDNVLYEIANESGAYSTDWQYHMIRFVKDTEKRMAKQHPVGMTFQYSRDPALRGTNAKLFESPADWISPNPGAGAFNFQNNPPPADGKKVILSDTDHLWGIGGDVAWVWKSFLRGLNPIFMDPYKGAVLTGGAGDTWAPIRRAMGVARRLADGTELASMVPHPELADSGYCLADPGRAYIVLAPTGGAVTVNLEEQTGKLLSEWIDPVDGTATLAREVAGGGKRTLTCPRPAMSVLYLRR